LLNLARYSPDRIARQAADGRIVKAFLLSMAVFNLIETIIQGVAGATGIAATTIFGTVAIHAVVAVLCVIVWSKQPALPRAG
jgi:hypothetical protein